MHWRFSAEYNLEVKVLWRSLEEVTRYTQWAVGGIVAQFGSYISIYITQSIIRHFFHYFTLQYLHCYAPLSKTT